jgi:hypothetical protein
MTWNHRVVKKNYDGEIQYGIHEAFYNDKDELINITVDPVEVASETIEGLRWTLQKMLEALDKPIIDDETVEFVERDG